MATLQTETTIATQNKVWPFPAPQMNQLGMTLGHRATTIVSSTLIALVPNHKIATIGTPPEASAAAKSTRG